MTPTSNKERYYNQSTSIRTIFSTDLLSPSLNQRLTNIDYTKKLSIASTTDFEMEPTSQSNL